MTKDKNVEMTENADNIDEFNMLKFITLLREVVDMQLEHLDNAHKTFNNYNMNPQQIVEKRWPLLELKTFLNSERITTMSHTRLIMKIVTILISD